MTITLSLPNSSEGINQKQRIITKLNSLVTSQNFFRWEDSRLCCDECADLKTHNKVVIFLALFMDYNQDKEEGFHSFTCFGHKGGVGFEIEDYLLGKLEGALNNIETVNDINISIK